MKDENNSPALWRQLQKAAQVLAQVRAGMSGTAALAQVDSSLRPGVQALAFRVMRNYGRAQALRRLLVSRKPAEAVDALLCTALALLWNPEDRSYDDFTLVNQAVEAAKKQAASRAQAGFINACLRRFLREREALVARTDKDVVARWNHPAWWVERLQQDHPQHWQAILQAQNRQPPMSLRVNTRRISVADYLARLAQARLEAVANGRDGVQLLQPRPVHEIVGFDQGLVSVQDAAAQLAAPLLMQGLAQGTDLRVLDACAAPGGKTAHLLEIAECELIGLDIDAQRCEKIGENLQRLGLQAEVRAADASQPQDWWDGRPFDAILLDAPCSASGITRRHPDIRWLRRETDIAQLVGIQAALLARLWPLLKPGGRLLYCTCSVFKAEGEQQIQTFLAHNTEARLLPSPGHLLPDLIVESHGVRDNRISEQDGFYYALLEKLAPGAGRAAGRHAAGRDVVDAGTGAVAGCGDHGAPGSD
ncbi:MAG: 16S rRNA (cytosine(967)-C(5))-methyltransferase RsmB [Hylemonella sp.]|nr:16S rRNA (cytosine(967)-C(5))-methyltransferase RsmB [Hylemonella sp.]